MAEHEYKPTEVERERLEEAAERLRHSGYGHLSAAVERATESLTHMLDGLRAEARAEALADLHAREDLVEIVAKAMHESMDEGLEWELLHERVRSVYRNHARAVLTAVAHSLGGSRPERIAATYDEPYELIRLEDAISNIDYPGADSEEWTYKAKVAARELMKAVRADERAPFQLILAMPAPGWFTFGSHADQPDLELEFWGAETSLDGLPIWERPAAPSEEVVDAAARALDSTGNVFGDVFWTRPALQAQQRDSLLATARSVLVTARQEETRDH